MQTSANVRTSYAEKLWTHRNNTFLYKSQARRNHIGFKLHQSALGSAADQVTVVSGGEQGFAGSLLLVLWVIFTCDPIRYYLSLNELSWLEK